VIGDADAWMANWSVAAIVREEATIVVHGGAREQRVFHSGRGLFPLLDDVVAQCLVIASDGSSRRAAWPSRPATENVA
jgi:S-DNA-T family DNA segregation ATPase FtsK/SpoIIIE